MSHNGLGRDMRTTQQWVSACRQHENTRKYCAVIRPLNDDIKALLRVIEQIHQSGIWGQPIDVYEELQSYSDGSMDGTVGNEHQRNSADSLVANDVSNQDVFETYTHTTTSRSTLTLVPTDLSYLNASHMQTRGIQEPGSPSIPISAADDNAEESLSPGSRRLGMDFLEIGPELPLFYIGCRGRDCAVNAYIDTGAKAMVARLSIAKRGNARIQRLRHPKILLTFNGLPIFSNQFVWLDLFTFDRPHEAQRIKVYLLEDRFLPFVDAYVDLENAKKFGARLVRDWREKRLK
ncbi:uncharacterized protein Z519_11874 [Cladophialophora bantiana CBS 173.52]|uniref:Uncharacterized protein n=1 Tax=Cladophialophora bantiana (strain ATCC 10958 / CBS 173.52 / CDC B-1940 / NIH 8579) TaxID=1442370 RepID=A0A0D2H9L7_CLAB1|nr:uncharacterized protein Z519_11874 [Cladophialophora bantiana CBS 173.52]KIW87550.1 hypothetical protein Z519_11874 [Cladophialophora bantiana CBS 173.52]